MLDVRTIGMKMRCRAKSSTTSPLTRGASMPARRCTTTSRNRPTWSPDASRTGRPRMRETKIVLEVADATRAIIVLDEKLPLHDASQTHVEPCAGT